MAYSESLPALNALQERKGCIDWILVEVDMPIVNGYEFLSFLNKEQINVPLITMSWDDSMVSMMRAFRLVAHDYWIKPLHEIRFKSMRTHFLKKCVSEEDTSQKETETDCLIRRISDNSEPASSMALRSNNNNFEEDDDVDESINPPSTKKPRVVWEEKLHGAFINAIKQIGIENVVPKKILEAMNVPGLERGHVASHLQKYKKYLKQKQQKQQQQQNDMSLVSVTQIEQQQQQNDMSLVSRRQQQSQQNDMSWNTEPRMCAVERVHLQPLSATAMTNFYPGFTGNMEEAALAHDHHPLGTVGNIAITENCSEEQSSPNTQLGDNFHAEEEALAHDHNLASN